VATRTIVQVTCDMPHPVSDTAPDAATFELYSRVSGRYEVDLCESCASKIFAPAVANGRKVPATRRK
jgi:hypothetical protein